MLLLVRSDAGEVKKDRFLCGHDEREWFVAAVPGTASTVVQAKDALQPLAVRIALAQSHVPARQRHWRRNDAFHRQGGMVLRAGAAEWKCAEVSATKFTHDLEAKIHKVTGALWRGSDRLDHFIKVSSEPGRQGLLR